jgi:AraC-like DNA-binding protein
MRDDLVFLHGAHRPACVATVDKRFDYHTLQFMARGGLWLSIDRGEPRQLHGAWTWCAHPGPHIHFHEWPRGRPWVHRYVAFTGRQVARWADDGLIFADPIPVPSAGVARYAVTFDELLKYSQRADVVGRLRARNLLERLLIDRAEARAATVVKSTSAWPAWVAQAFDLLRDETVGHDYTAIADRLAMAPSTLRRKFRETTGMPIHQHAIAARLGRAKHLLEQPDLSIKQVAARTGYRDVFYFNRHFTKVFGVSPGRYRKSVQR